MTATIFTYQNGILEKECQYTEYDQLTLDDAQKTQMAELRNRYQQRPKRDPKQTYLIELGSELYQWLNQRNWLDHILQNVLAKPWIVEFRLLNDSPQDDEADFIHLPWEILAKDGQFLAADFKKQYSPVRRLGKALPPPDPSPHKPAMLFMAASPEGSNVLNYEAEEAIILEATGGLYQNNLDVFVEESGNLAQLSNELNRLNGVDILHLSCHGTADHQLMLETETGQEDRVDSQQLRQELSHHQPRLIFLSACHSAESQQQQENQGLSMGLIQAGYENVLGWADSVNDDDASRFSSLFYEHISKAGTLENALAQSRLQALNPSSQKSIIRDWHLARLYCSPQGGGVIANGSSSRIPYQAQLGEKEFLGAKQQTGLQVAGRNEFVGRRRSIQHALAAWRQGKNSLLIHGMGRQGKSSLAARLANRMQHLKLVVIYGQYDAAFIAKEIGDQCNDPEIDQQLSPQILQQLRDKPQQLKALLHPILKKGILLVIDDLEQILEAQDQQRHRIANDRDKEQQTILALIKAFHSTATPSRLLFTSRFPFDLFEQNKNWGSEHYLHYEGLPAMTEEEQEKQYRLQQIKEGLTLDYSQQRQLLELVGGNPGLQDLLFTLLTAEEPSNEKHC